MIPETCDACGEPDCWCVECGAPCSDECLTDAEHFPEPSHIRMSRRELNTWSDKIALSVLARGGRYATVV